jgi:hypothetical protein
MGIRSERRAAASDVMGGTMAGYAAGDESRSKIATVVCTENLVPLRSGAYRVS